MHVFLNQNINQRWYSPCLKGWSTFIKMTLSYTFTGEVNMVSGKTKPPHYSNQIILWSSKTITLLKYQWEMVSGQPKKPPHEESKSPAWIHSTMNN
jgi:hypothetical protein